MADSSLKLHKSTRHDLDGSGAVEITGLPHILQTKAFAHPDVLFVPLLECARQALADGHRISEDKTDNKQVLKLAGMHIAGFLFSDSNFTPAAKGFAHPNYYIIDLEQETIDVHSRLFAAVNNRCSMFRVKISGSLHRGPYAVLNLADGSTVAEISEEQIRTPDFFVDRLPEECMRMQFSREHAKQIIKTQKGIDDLEVRLTLPMPEGSTPVILRKNQTGFGWLLFDASTGMEFGKVAQDTMTSLGKVLEHLVTVVIDKRVAPAGSRKQELPDATAVLPAKPAGDPARNPATRVAAEAEAVRSRS